MAVGAGLGRPPKPRHGLPAKAPQTAPPSQTWPFCGIPLPGTWPKNGIGLPWRCPSSCLEPGHEILVRLLLGSEGGPRARSRLRRSERRASLCWASSSRITASVLWSRAARTSSGFSPRSEEPGGRPRDRRLHDRPTLAPRVTRSSSSCSNVSPIASAAPVPAASRPSFEG